MKLNYDINPISKDYFFLTSTESALIERSLMDWHLQYYLQNLAIPATPLHVVIDNVLLVESMNHVELIENLAVMESMIYGGEWQDENPKKGSMILAIRPFIYELFKPGRVKNTEDLFKEQGWDYTGQYVKRMDF